MSSRVPKMSVLLYSVVLSACASSSKTHLADGSLGYSINCSGSMLNWDSCYERAERLCGEQGFSVREKTGEEGLTVKSDHSTLNRGSIVHRSMVIQCKQ